MNAPDRVYPPLPVQLRLTTQHAAKVCIVSPEVVGPSKNGGVGTAYTSLAEALARAGQEVTLLYGQPEECASRDLAYWVRFYAAKKIRFVPLPRCKVPTAATFYALRSFDTMEWLKRNGPFDVIHFPEWTGIGYYTLAAKRQGLGFSKSTICVGIHSCTAWLTEGANDYVDDLWRIELDFLERRSAELADVVVSPSQYLLNWIVDRGWKVPSTSFVQQYVMPESARSANTPMRSGADRVKELVFFGRLETRKGLALFCDALDRLPVSTGRSLERVTFLGKDSSIEGLPGTVYIRRRAESWPFPVQVLTDKIQPEAMAYLAQDGLVAVVPSLLENSPNTVYECLGIGLKFIAARTGGIPELIAPEHRESLCFDTNPTALVSKLVEALTNGVPRSCLAVDPDENERAWIEWHKSVIGAAGEAPNTKATQPRVTVCLTTHDQPESLTRALESILHLAYPDLEVVLVDNGSLLPGTHTIIEGLQPQFHQRGWKILRQEESHIDAARNLASRVASGDYLLFMSDDHRADPQQLRKLVNVACRTGADIVTCGVNQFASDRGTSSKEALLGRRLPLGPATVLGALQNCFGESTALVRRGCFEKLGGFPEDYPLVPGDWELYARAVLKGYRLEAVPEFLCGSWAVHETALTGVRAYQLHSRAIRPYTEAVSSELRMLVRYVQGANRRLGYLAGQIPHAELMIQWRSKLEAGVALAGLGQRQAAVKFMVAAVKAVETCKNPGIILQALLEICSHLGNLDAGRTRFLLGIAIRLAENTKRVAEKQRAEKLLSTLPASGEPVAV